MTSSREKSRAESALLIPPEGQITSHDDETRGHGGRDGNTKRALPGASFTRIPRGKALYIMRARTRSTQHAGYYYVCACFDQLVSRGEEKEKKKKTRATSRHGIDILRRWGACRRKLSLIATGNVTEMPIYLSILSSSRSQPP